MDSELIAAGIGPGHPSLFLSPDLEDPEPGNALHEHHHRAEHDHHGEHHHHPEHDHPEHDHQRQH
jgi:hypothetical protein